MSNPDLLTGVIVRTHSVLRNSNSVPIHTHRHAYIANMYATHDLSKHGSIQLTHANLKIQ